MSKTVKIIVVTVVLIILVAILMGVFTFKKASEVSSKLAITSEEELTTLVDEIYENVTIEMPMLMTMPIDLTDIDAVTSFTGLENAENIEYAVASEPMMSAQAYSMVLVKVKDGVNADTVAKEMNENVNERKWICVTAESIYTAASGNVICLVMSNDQTAKTVFDSFRTLAGTTNEEYLRTVEEPEMPEDMLFDGEDIDEVF